MNEEKKKQENGPKKPRITVSFGNGGNNKKNARKKGRNPLYWVYGAILLALAILWMDGSGKTAPKDITWSKLEPILLNHDQEKIVVVNQEFAEIHIKQEAIDRDSTYNELLGQTLFGGKTPEPTFYKYQFVTFESFEKDLERVEQQIITRDTMGISDSTGVISPTQLAQIQKNANIELVPEKRTKAFREFILLFGPFILLIIFFIVMSRMSARNMGGGSGGIFSVGKSKAKLYDGETSTGVTFKDVAGLHGAKEEVMEVVDFLKNPKRYTNLGGKIPKGVLLVGPPGTGKTLLAKAVAGEANVPFFSMSGSDFVEMFVGVGASRVRDLFEEAKKKSPCIIFIDEIDAVGRARGRSGLSNANDERENTLNQLLTEMDGFGTNNGVIVLAATNRADVLDKALLRAGRFDRQIYVDLPDLEERKAIFDVHLKKLKLSDEINRDFLSKQTPGFSGADIANVCNEAALVAARKQKEHVEKQDFLDAIDRIIGGLEKRSKVLSEQEKRTIAYHESGHASVSWLLEWGDPLVKVTIVPRGKALGAAWYLPEERQLTTYEQMFHNIVSLMAGRAAEESVFGRISTGALNDLERATKMAQSMVIYYGMSPEVGQISYYDSTGQADWNFTKPFSEKTAETIDKEVGRILDEAYSLAKQIINDNRSKIDQLASILFDREVIFKDDVEAIFGPRPWDKDKDKEKADEKKDAEESHSEEKASDEKFESATNESTPQVETPAASNPESDTSEA